MRIVVANRAEFLGQVNAWINAVERGASLAVFKMLVDAQTFARNHSPVYSGDFASNWNVSYGIPDASFTSTKDYYGPDYPEAVTQPWGTGNVQEWSGYRLGMPAFLTNAADHDEPYAWLIEKNRIHFRPSNEGKGAVRAKTLNHLKNNYTSVTKAMLV